MKEKIKKICNYKDLMDQFFCYVSRSGDQLIFSKFMLSLDGYSEFVKTEQIWKMGRNELYFTRFEIDGCNIYQLSTVADNSAMELGQRIGTVFCSLNAILSFDFDIVSPDNGSEFKNKNLLKKRVDPKSFPKCDEFKRIANNSKENASFFKNYGFGLLVVIVLIILLMGIGTYFPEIFK